MANQLLLDHPYCKVWQASDELIKLLPAEDAAPRHTLGKMQAIMVEKEHGLNWITCTSCPWHTDWDEVFEFVVVRGKTKLYISNSEKSEFDLDNRDKGDASIFLKRGYIIQLWPLVKHRIGVFGDAAMIELMGLNKPIFKTQDEQEKAFTSYIRTHYVRRSITKSKPSWE